MLQSSPYWASYAASGGIASNMDAVYFRHPGQLAIPPPPPPPPHPTHAVHSNGQATPISPTSPRSAHPLHSGESGTSRTVGKSSMSAPPPPPPPPPIPRMFIQGMQRHVQATPTVYGNTGGRIGS